SRSAYRGTNLNSYQSSGPNNIAGRSRAFDFDSRNPNIIITGGTQGGIFRSTDGGANWTFVSPAQEIRSATSIVQDPTQPDTWYCGTGEAWYPASSADVSNGTLGYGIFKSTNNGQSWTKLAATVANNDENIFESPFDLVHRLAVHPTTGYVYAAVHRRIMRSKDRGVTWEQVLGSNSSSTVLGGITDVIIPSNGSKIFAAVTGENADRSFVGVWESTSGDAGTWKRIAGGTQASADSVAGWKAYPKWSRIVLALNRTNTQLFTLYKNGESASGGNPKPEADLFRADISSGNPTTYTWTNLNSYVPDEPNFNSPVVDPYTTQFSGYNMCLEVKPDNDNILFIGGTVLERVDLSQTDPARKFRR
ncbi:MAG TPA: sialidase family protein, partial [Flavisolibacter sp.]|nr:sialidase family protein [Flavisolibacter sp.]